jgi:hypothetical protein
VTEDPTSTQGDDGDAADAALLAALRPVVRAADPVPAGAVDAARSALAYLRMDAELAALSWDSADDTTLAGVRSASVPVRQLSFEAGAIGVELEITVLGDSRELIGQCVPAGTVELLVRQPGEELATTTDDLGRFRCTIAPGPVALRCHWPHTGQTIETSWVRA